MWIRIDLDAVGAAAAAGEATASVEVAFWALPDPVVTSWESSPPSPPEPEPEPEPPEEPPPEEPALEPPGQPRRAPRSPQGVVVVVVVGGGTVVVVVVVVVDAAGLLAADDTGGVRGGVAAALLDAGDLLEALLEQGLGRGGSAPPAQRVEDGRDVVQERVEESRGRDCRTAPAWR